MASVVKEEDEFGEECKELSTPVGGAYKVFKKCKSATFNLDGTLYTIGEYSITVTCEFFQCHKVIRLPDFEKVQAGWSIVQNKWAESLHNTFELSWNLQNRNLLSIGVFTEREIIKYLKHEARKGYKVFEIVVFP